MSLFVRRESRDEVLDTTGLQYEFCFCVSCSRRISCVVSLNGFFGIRWGKTVVFGGGRSRGGWIEMLWLGRRWCGVWRERVRTRGEGRGGEGRGSGMER